MRIGATHFFGASSTLATLFFAAGAAAQPHPSGWSDKVGFILGDDSTTWCETTLTSTGATSSFTKVPSDIAAQKVTSSVSNVAQQMVRVACSRFGSTTVVQDPNGWSLDKFGDTSTAQCPPGWVPTLAECRVQGQVDNGPAVTLPFVYQGSACGNGIPTINGSATLLNQLFESPNSGFSSYQPFPSPMRSVGPLPAPDNTQSVGIGGADLGTPFMVGGILNFAFGDWFTSCSPANACVPAPGYHSGAVAETTDIDPSAGIVLQSWQTPKNSQTAATMFLPRGVPTEQSIVPGAGFAVTPANGSGDETSFVWYISVEEYYSPGNQTVNPPIPAQPFLANYAGLASYTAASNTWTLNVGPQWPATSNFGPGAVWQDRYNQEIYFFGVRPQQGPPNDPSTNAQGQKALPYSGIRVAKVASNVNDIKDPSKYFYWDGQGHWVRDAGGTYAPAIPLGEPNGQFGAAADLVPAVQGLVINDPRSEISVAYDSYANRFILMFLNNNDGSVRLWQAPAVTGPWAEVPFDTFALPDLSMIVPPTPLPPAIYAPFTSDHLLTNAGADVYFLLSEFFPSYNVGTWHINLNRSTSCSLVP